MSYKAAGVLTFNFGARSADLKRLRGMIIAANDENPWYHVVSDQVCIIPAIEVCAVPTIDSVGKSVTFFYHPVRKVLATQFHAFDQHVSAIAKSLLATNGVGIQTLLAHARYYSAKEYFS